MKPLNQITVCWLHFFAGWLNAAWFAAELSNHCRQIPLTVLFVLAVVCLSRFVLMLKD